MIRFKAYLEMVGTQLEKAEDRVDYDECIRLVRVLIVRVLIEASEEYIRKVEKEKK